MTGCPTAAGGVYVSRTPPHSPTMTNFRLISPDMLGRGVLWMAVGMSVVCVESDEGEE
jgi:hypothetical protein